MPIFLCIVDIIIQLLHIQLVQVIAPYCVIEIDEFAQVCIHYECSIIHAKFRLSGDLQTHHSELLSGCGPRRVHIEIDLFDIKHDKPSEKLSGAKRFKHVLPVVSAVNLMCAHSMYVDDMHRGGNFVDENEWTDPSEYFLELGGQNDKVVLADGRKLQDV